MKPKTAAEFDDAARRAADASTSSTSQESSVADIVAPAPPGEPPAASQTERDTPPSESEMAQLDRVGGKWTTDVQKLALIAAVQGGMGARAAAASVGVNLRTAYNVLASLEDDTEALRAATQRLLALGAVDAVDQWRVAMDVGARKKGNHAPARDWLMHAGVLDPLATDASVNVRVAICIGTDERPMRIASPLQHQRPQEDSE